MAIYSYRLALAAETAARAAYTLGWDEGSAGLVISDTGRAALDTYRQTLETLPGAVPAKPSLIRGLTFAPPAVVDNASEMVEAIRAVVSALTGEVPEGEHG